MGFIQFVIENILATVAAVVSAAVGILEIVKAVKKQKVNKRKLIMMVSGAIFAIAFVYLMFQYISTDKSIAEENNIITSVTLNKTDFNMLAGKSEQIKATVLYSDNSTDGNVMWISSNEEIATVDSSGVVVAHSTGEVEIIAQASKGNISKEARCKIHVKNLPTGYDISLSTNRAFWSESFYIYVIPHDENVEVTLYAKAPSGSVDILNYSAEKKYYIDKEIGVWTIYAQIKNEYGVYEASKPEDFVTIEILPLDFEGISQG